MAGPTDPQLREEMMATVRKFVARDVVPVANGLEHADEYPTDIVAAMKDLGLFGITIPEEYGGLGLYADHRLPADSLIGTAGRGLAQILAVLEVGRINIAARAVGVARAAFDAALAYAQERRTMGKPIAEHQAIQIKLADMATRLEAARLLTVAAAERKQAGIRCDVEAGMAKLFASETALELATEALRVHGGVGYTTELPVERYYRDAPLMIIGEGTNEIQRLVIARGLLARASEGR